MATLVNMLVLAASVMIVTRIMPGIRVKNFTTAMLVAVGISVLNFIVYKLLFLLAVPFILLTGFIGYFVINALILWAVDQWVDDFEVKGTGNLVMGSLAISFVSSVLGWLLGVIF